MLRLFMRSCPRTSSIPMLKQNTTHVAENIASDTIDSAVSYLGLRNQARPWSTYLTLLLVDVSSRVAPIMKRHAANPTMPAYRVILSIVNAQGFLKNLVQNKLSVTGRAAARLDELSVDVNHAFTMAMGPPRPIDAGISPSWGSDRQADATDLVLDSTQIDDWMFDVSNIWQVGEVVDLFSSEAFGLDLNRWNPSIN